MYAKSDFRKELVAFMGYRFCRTTAGSMLRSEDCQQKKEEKPNVFPPQHIIRRYYYQKGEIQESLKTDECVSKALDLLMNRESYKAILQPSKQQAAL
jgi:hypothetical protein